jgi:hypothetical protein
MARWFQSDLSIGDRCEILEGDAFANKVVARAETPEIAAAIVAEHNAAETREEAPYGALVNALMDADNELCALGLTPDAPTRKTIAAALALAER